eukprot:scaffold149490_cov15-Prasinocladus_malaysianus.AAC.1
MQRRTRDEWIDVWMDGGTKQGIRKVNHWANAWLKKEANLRSERMKPEQAANNAQQWEKSKRGDVLAGSPVWDRSPSAFG